MTKVPLKPLGDRVIAVQPDAKAETKTASGLYLPAEAKEKSTTAKVVAVGPEVKAVKKGDEIVYREYAVTELKHDKTTYLVIKEEDILATLEGSK